MLLPMRDGIPRLVITSMLSGQKQRGPHEQIHSVQIRYKLVKWKKGFRNFAHCEDIITTTNNTNWFQD